MLWLEILAPIVFALSFILYVFIHIKLLMIENEWGFSKSISHYLKLRCIFPKKQLLSNEGDSGSPMKRNKYKEN